MIIVPNMFHGTDHDFTQFQSNRITWFTSDHYMPFFQYHTDDSKPWYIFHVELHLRAPADLHYSNARYLLNSAGFDPDQVGTLTDCSEQVIKFLSKHGYDSLAFEACGDRQYAAFYPSQIVIHRREVLPPNSPPPKVQ